MIEQRTKPNPHSRKTVGDIVQERIREAIVSGVLVGGARIDQNRLAASLNVSLVPVREALKKLEGEGFVHIVPRRGAFVSQTSQEDIDDLYFMRRLLEGQAGYHAAERLTADDLTVMNVQLALMNDALDADDIARFMELNRRFHFVIYQAAGSPHLLQSITSLWDLAGRYRFRFTLVREQGRVLQAEHQAILDACRARDKEALRDTTVDHINQSLIIVQQSIRGVYG